MPLANERGIHIICLRLLAVRKSPPQYRDESLKKEASTLPMSKRQEKKAARQLKLAARNRKLTAAERRARRERKRNYMTIFINGKQKRVPRPQLIDGLPVDEFIARNADPIWLHQNELWEFMPPE
jgi:hypothetical protein